MTQELSLLGALLIGLLGSSHCVGMCGGIVGALTLSLPETARRPWWRLLPYMFAYNIGRVGTYTLLGALLGYMGTLLLHSSALASAQAIGQYLAAGFVIALGFYLGGWWRILERVEKIGAHLWTCIEPLGRQLLPLKSPAHAFGFGMLWGFLPCGMVYSVLVWASASGSAVQGAALMAAFGIGTLPMLLVMGNTAAWLRRALQRKIVRQMAGLLILSLGIYLLFAPLSHNHNVPNLQHSEHSSAS